MKVPHWTFQRIQAMTQLLGHHLHYPNAQPRHLTLPELGTLIVVAGRDAGFKIKTEANCGPGMRYRMDCAWYSPNADLRADDPIVAWEFHARNVPRDHLEGVPQKKHGTFEKLCGFSQAIKIQALYSIRGGLKKMGRYHENLGFKALLEARQIRVLTDEDLLDGELQRIVNAALETA